MNCKPGDLAVYVGKMSPLDVGLIVRCISPVRLRIYGSEDCTLVPGWVIDPPLRHTPCPNKDLASDSSLRPIRDPGEDAVDEMLQRVGKPESAAIEWALGVRDVTPL